MSRVTTDWRSPQLRNVFGHGRVVPQGFEPMITKSMSGIFLLLARLKPWYASDKVGYRNRKHERRASRYQ